MSSDPSSQGLGPEGRAFLQHRLALFGAFGAGMFGFFWLYRVLMTVAGLPLERLWDATMLWHLGASVCLALPWLTCRRGERSVRFLRGVELMGIVGAGLCMQAMGAYMQVINQPAMIVILATTLALVMRAVYVPSSARRTLLIACALGVPLVVGFYFLSLEADMSTFKQLYPDAPDTAQEMALGNAGYIAAWWALTTAATVSTSQVIYGLRREMREAQKLGQYTLEQTLGEGGMGVVYRARHALLRRPTALKLMRSDHGGSDVARFEREVQLTAQLTHPNTITIYDFGRTPDGLFYYVMELLRGANLGEVVEAGGPQSPARVAHLLEQVAAALDEAHGAGLIHRDIKPQNIMVCDCGGERDVAKVVDFGLVKDLGERESGMATTSPHVVTGTPLFISPEALTHPERLDGRADLYSLGAVGYYLLTGTHMFSGNTAVEVCSAHLHRAVQPPSERLGAPLPEALEALILACVAKQPDDRPADARALLQGLRETGLSQGWSQAQAEAWWTAHPDLDVHGAQPIRPSDKTLLEVNLAERKREAVQSGGS